MINKVFRTGTIENDFAKKGEEEEIYIIRRILNIESWQFS